MKAAPHSTEALPPEVAAFIQSGVSITVASCNSALQTTLSRGFGCQVSPDRTRITVFVHAAQAAALLADVQENGMVAAAFSLPSTHKTIQIKGRQARVQPLRPFDYASIAQHTNAFVDELLPFGEFSEALLRAVLEIGPEQGIALSFTPTTRFSQTPGPGAGCPLP